MKKNLLLITFLSISISNAQVQFSEDFSTYTVGQTLNGQGTWTNNSSNNGGLGTCSGFGCVNSKIQTFSLTYPNYGSSAKALEVNFNQDAVGTTIPVTSSGNFYVSFIINFSNAVINPGGTASQDFFRVMSAGNYNTSMRMGAYKVGAAFQLFVQKGGGTKIYSSDLAFNQNHLIVLKYTYNAGTTDDLVSLFVNPDMSMAEPVTTLTTTALGASETDWTGGIDRLNFRQNYSTIPTGYVGVAKTSLTWNNLSNLANDKFSKSAFEIISNKALNGILNIKSNSTFDAISIAIYDIQGRKIDSKNKSLVEGDNEIAINPIQNKGFYIIEIASENNKISKKIVVQ